MRALLTPQNVVAENASWRSTRLLVFFAERDVNLVALDEALNELAQLDPQQSRVVELRFFGGMTNEEIAEVLKITPGTVRYDWRMAKAWLHRTLSEK
jgi:RNA polymerase sigma factor (sigma-70 family)